MALETIGLGGRLTFDSSRAIASMMRTRASFAQLRMGAQRVGAGLGMMSSAARSATFAVLPLALAMGAGVSQAAAFEKQMSGVGAVLLKTPDQMTDLAAKAKQMGIETVFSATQSAEAMEAMARAGFNTQQIMTGVEGVMHAAAAEGIGLAEATQIVTSTLKGFNLAAEDTSKVSDILALTSARTNTTIVGLGEGLKFVSPIARGLGVSLEETAATLGLLADSGLKGTLAGTAMKNALLKLAAPTGAGQTALKKLGLTVKTSTGDFVGMTGILTQLQSGMNKVGGAVDRTAVAAKLFGLRGVALTNLMTRMDKATSGGALTFQELVKQLKEADGAAKQMAEIRLNNLAGAATLLKSSLEGVSIALFGEMLKPMAATVRVVTGALNNVLFAFNLLSAPLKKGETAQSRLTEATEKYGMIAVAVAQGVRDAILFMERGWDRITDAVKKASDWVKEKFGEDGVRSFTKFAIVVGVVAAAVAPILLGLVVVGFLISAVATAVVGLITVVSGLGTILAAVFSPVILVVLGAAALIFGLLREENESLGKTISRVWGNIKDWVMDVWKNALRPLWMGIKDSFGPIVEELGIIWQNVKESILFAISDIVNQFSSGTEGMEVNWREVGQTIGSVLGTVISMVSTLVSWIVRIAALAIPTFVRLSRALVGFILTPFELIWDMIKNVITAVKEIFSGNIITGLKRMGLTLLDSFLLPIRFILENAIKLAEAFDFEVPPGLKKFAEEGLTGFVFPERPEAAAEIMKKQAGTAEAIATTKAEQISQRKARQRARREAPPTIETKVEIEDKRTIEIDNKVSIDGSEVAAATAKHRQEVQERSGFKATPWQRRMILEHGAAPVGVSGG